MLKAAPLRPGEIVRRSRVTATPLTIINPDNFDFVGSPSNPGTPWDREVSQLDARERRMHQSPRSLAVSTPSEQRDFLGKVVSYVKVRWLYANSCPVAFASGRHFGIARPAFPLISPKINRIAALLSRLYFI